MKPLISLPPPVKEVHPANSPVHATKSLWLSDEQAAVARGVVRSKSMPEPNSGCWLWTGYAISQGYGALRVSGITYYAHRVSFTAHKGTIPSGLFILHRCDNTYCVNPDHLFAGTGRDNVRDSHKKKRRKNLYPVGGSSMIGECCPTAKLTGDEAREIYCSSGNIKQIASRFGVSPSAVSDIRHGRSWRYHTADLRGEEWASP